jgi:hypothetical protein
MFTPTPPRRFGYDQADGVLLAAIGFEAEHFDANWTDYGDAESGPMISGHPAATIWSASADGLAHSAILIGEEWYDFDTTPDFDDVPF